MTAKRKRSCQRFAGLTTNDVLAGLNLCDDIIVAAVEPPTSGRWGEGYFEGWPFPSVLGEGRQVESIDLDPGTLFCKLDADGWVEFAARIDAEITLDGFAHKSDVYSSEDLSLSIQDSDWNDHYMRVHEYHQAKLLFRLTLDETGSVIEECSVREAQSTTRWGPPSQCRTLVCRRAGTLAKR